ncbi:MAG: transcriptional repressor LexA [Gammaproteobacteria bacterium]|nr:transcriptional repressor LexA [Gammaproteobacteria bacterium]
MRGLTPRQREIMQLICRYMRDRNMPPTRAEIAEHFGFKSANAAEEHLRALAKKGLIELRANSSRGIQLLPEAAEHVPECAQLSAANDPEIDGLPIIGRVAAGSPVLAEQHIEDTCQIPPSFFHPPANYLLRVKGDSMINVGILDGDLLAVHSTQEVRNGQIVVARIGEEVTVKRFERVDSTRIHLHPENDDYNIIKVDLRDESFNIEGLYVGVLRH